MFRNDRDTVICFLTGKLDVLVTCRAKLPMRKTSIDALRLLQTQNIRLLSTTPIVNEPDPRVDAVYVPGGNLHDSVISDLKFGHYGSMIAGPFEAAGLFVDPAASTFFGERSRRPDVVDPKALVALPGTF